jgi:hypothetical protein
MNPSTSIIRMKPRNGRSSSDIFFWSNQRCPPALRAATGRQPGAPTSEAKSRILVRDHLNSPTSHQSRQPSVQTVAGKATSRLPARRHWVRQVGTGTISRSTKERQAVKEPLLFAVRSFVVAAPSIASDSSSMLPTKTTPYRDFARSSVSQPSETSCSTRCGSRSKGSP